MEVYLIRHGQSYNNAQDDSANRVCDPPLTDIGHEQAQRVAVHVRDGDYGIQKLYCSAMLRTLQTVDPIAKALGLTPEIWIDVHEEGGIWLDRGEGPIGLSGLCRSEIENQFPGFVIPDEISEDGWWNRPKESDDDLNARALRVAQALNDHRDAVDLKIGIVTHGAFANALLQAMISGSALPGVYFGHHNTAISRIDYVDGMVRPRFLNRVEHLSQELRT
jgi:2,3-bisphosphoglycerate-dependent phosphoglycerate mutase